MNLLSINVIFTAGRLGVSCSVAARSDNTPMYLSDDCQLISDVSTRRLHSTDTATCTVQRSHNTFGDRYFATAGPPRLWNSLSSKLRQRDTLGEFKRLLRTHLFDDHSNCHFHCLAGNSTIIFSTIQLF